MSEEAVRSECASAGNELRTDYVRTLRIWRRHFPPEQFLVLFYDDIVRDPADVLRRVCRFIDASPLESAGYHRVNETTLGLPWPELARVKADLSRRWLPMLTELERQCGEPVTQWRLSAEARIRAAEAASEGAGAANDNTVLNNAAAWDHRHTWPRDGDEWDGQARVSGLPYDEWKSTLLARYLPLFPEGGVTLEIGPGHGRWSEHLLGHCQHLVLCDISPNCLDACQARLASRGSLRTYVSQGCDLPADLTGAVDAVWSFDCFVHIGPAETADYVGEIARVLKPGAVAVLHHPDRPAPADVGWRAPVTRDDVRRWAEGAGLIVERQESTWQLDTDNGPRWVGVPRLGDCITVLRRPGIDH